MLKKAVLLAAIVVVVTASTWVIRSENGEAVAPQMPDPQTAVGGSMRFSARAGEAGVGWHSGETLEQSVRGAIDAARGEQAPDFVMMVFASELDGRRVVAAARRHLGPHTKIFGVGAHRPDFLDSASLASGRDTGRAVAVQAIRSPRVRFGVAGAEYRAHASPHEAARAAVRHAIADAGKTLADRPQVVLIAPTRGAEEEVVAGIESVLGTSVPVLGGTANGGGYVIGGDVTSQEGVGVALIYTELTIGWTFEAGYDVSVPKSGTVTRVDGQVLAEIDHRPAWQVYDEWLNGKLAAAMSKSDAAAGQLLALNPIYREYKAPSGQVFALFSHAWPVRRDGRWEMNVATTLKPGERIHLSHGTWELLMNRVANLPRTAKARGGLPQDEKPFFGIGFLCAGVTGVLPPDELPKAPVLMGYAMNGAPYVVAITGGEQGFLPGIGNKHANLSTGFLVVRDAD